VALYTYGDDLIEGVSEKCCWFNHTSIQRVLTSIGVGFTMADKTATSVPYISMKDASFLKRSWRWESELESYVCPLEHDSINNMLTMCVVSKTISMQVHSLEVLECALREYFWYGRELFEVKSELFNQVIADCELEPYMIRCLPTWDFLKAEYIYYSDLKSD
jgi:hypothetical protein